MSHQAETINHIIQTRRSVKPGQFRQGALIPEAVIKQALVNATWAPNHGKTEPWFFIVYTGEGIKRLCDYQAALYKSESGEKFTEAKYQKLKEGYLQASHVVAICLKRQVSKIPEIEEIAAVSCAVQNFALTLHAYGYGGYWTTGGITYYESAKPFFGLTTGDTLMGFYLCGVPEEAPPAPARKGIDDKVFWVSQ